MLLFGRSYINEVCLVTTSTSTHPPPPTSLLLSNLQTYVSSTHGTKGKDGGRRSCDDGSLFEQRESYESLVRKVEESIKVDGL